MAVGDLCSQSPDSTGFTVLRSQYFSNSQCHLEQHFSPRGHMFILRALWMKTASVAHRGIDMRVGDEPVEEKLEEHT